MPTRPTTSALRRRGAPLAAGAALLFTLGVPGGAAAQPAPAARAAAAPSTPEAAAAAFAAVMRRADWPAAAALMHPAALARLSILFAPLVRADTAGALRRGVFGVPTAAAFAGLSDAERFVRLMRFLASRSPQVGTALAGTETQVLGHVREGRDTAHVVVRTRTPAGGATVERTSVMSMQRAGAGWGMLLSGDLEGLAAALRGRGGGG